MKRLMITASLSLLFIQSISATPADRALENLNPVVLKKSLEKGFRISTPLPYFTAFIAWAQSSKTEKDLSNTWTVLKEAGYHPDQADASGKTALMIIIESDVFQPDTKIMAAGKLTTLGASVNAQDKYGNTALHLAAYWKSGDFQCDPGEILDQEIFRALIQLGADPEIKNAKGLNVRQKAEAFCREYKKLSSHVKYRPTATKDG